MHTIFNYLLILSFLFPISIQAQKHTGNSLAPVIERYSSGEIKMRGRYKNYLLDGEVRTYYQNGQLWKLEHYKKGELNGVREYYYEDYVPEANGKFRPVGALDTRSFYEMGYQTGREESYYRSGQLQTEHFYTKEPSVWRGWYENGILRFEGDFIDDKGDGTWTYYFEDGKTPSQIMHLKEGRQEGEQYDYWPNGVIHKRTFYLDNTITEYEAWDENGNKLADSGPLASSKSEQKEFESRQDSLRYINRELQEKLNEAILSGDDNQITIAEENFNEFDLQHEEDFLDFIMLVFSEDERDGEFKLYYETGEVKVITPRSKGEMHGIQKVLYKDGSLARSVEYKHNVEDGAVQSFYKNGNPEVEGAMKNGRRASIWRFYNEDGILREEIDFSVEK